MPVHLLELTFLPTALLTPGEAADKGCRASLTRLWEGEREDSFSSITFSVTLPKILNYKVI